MNWNVKPQSIIFIMGIHMLVKYNFDCKLQSGIFGYSLNVGFLNQVFGQMDGKIGLQSDERTFTVVLETKGPQEGVVTA